MSEAPERIWTCNHVGEYGSYFPEAVEAEGEYGGEAVEYVRADCIKELEAKLAKAVEFLSEAVHDLNVEGREDTNARGRECLAFLTEIKGESRE